MAATDWPQVHSMDPGSLAVQSKLELPLTAGLAVASSAHWRREVGRHTSLQYYMFYNPITTKFDFALYRFGNTFEEHELVAKFEMPHMSVVHMFSNTERFAVIALYPVTIDFMAFPTHHMHPFETLKKLDDPVRFYLIDLNDGLVIDGFELDDPRLVFSAHHMNAWEEKGEVVLDLGTVPWDSFGVIFDVETMLNATLTTDDKGFFEMKRVRLNLADKSVTLEDWPNALGIPLLNTIDFPVINNNYSGRKNRYGYGWVSIDYWRMSLVKKDLEDSLNDKTWSSRSHYPGESFFIPRPGAQAEDDGLLVNVVFDGEARQSYLLLLDGQTFTEVILGGKHLPSSDGNQLNISVCPGEPCLPSPHRPLLLPWKLVPRPPLGKMADTLHVCHFNSIEELCMQTMKYAILLPSRHCPHTSL